MKLAVYLLVWVFIYYKCLCVRAAKAQASLRMRRLACAFADRLWDKQQKWDKNETKHKIKESENLT